MTTWRAAGLAGAVLLVALYARRNRKPAHLNPLDSVWLAMDEKTNVMVVNTMMLFDRPLVRERVLDVLRKRLLGEKRFRSIVRDNCWVECKSVDLDYHVQSHTVADGALRTVVSGLCYQPLPMDRPLWLIHIFENEKTGETCVLFRIHHAISDGVGLLTTLLRLADPDDPKGLEIQQVGRPGGLVRLGKVVYHILSSFVSRYLLLGQATDCVLLKKQGGLGKKKMGWTRPLPLSVIKKYAKDHGATINDAILALVGKAARDFVEKRQKVRKDLVVRCMIPLNVSPLASRKELKNDITMGVVDLFATKKNNAERIVAIHSETNRLKAGGEPLMYSIGIKALASLAPLWVLRAFVMDMTKKFSMAISNVPGPQCGLTFAGERVAQIVGTPPLQGEKIALSFGAFSYNGALTVGLYAEEDVVQDGGPEELLNAVETEFQQWAGEPLQDKPDAPLLRPVSAL